MSAGKMNLRVTWLKCAFRRARAALLAAALLLTAPAALALDADDLLAPEKAFEFSARTLDRGSIEVHYRIAKGYYLYRERFAFATDPATVTLGPPKFPAGIAHSDAFFGRTETYRNEVSIVVPVTGAPARLRSSMFSRLRRAASSARPRISSRRSAWKGFSIKS